MQQQHAVNRIRRVPGAHDGPRVGEAEHGATRLIDVSMGVFGGVKQSDKKK